MNKSSFLTGLLNTEKKNIAEYLATWDDLNIFFKNHILRKKDLICKRPGAGISLREFNKIAGKKVKYNLNEDHILKTKDII